MIRFDYTAEAELLPGRGRSSGRQLFRAIPFILAADALRFAMEEITIEQLGNIQLEVNRVRFDRCAIRRLYDSAEYPLLRTRRGEQAEIVTPPKPLQPA